MSTLYWITILDNLKDLGMLICALSLIFSSACFLANLFYAEEIKEGTATFSYKDFNKTKNWTYTILTISIIFFILISSLSIKKLIIFYLINKTFKLLLDVNKNH